jgi:hypothetical protein
MIAVAVRALLISLFLQLALWSSAASNDVVSSLFTANLMHEKRLVLLGFDF